jgi:hypothetical protein
MKSYGKAAAEAIIGNYGHDMIVVDEDGVRPSKTCLESDPAQLFHWNFACDLEGPDAPDALQAPSLPIPFTAIELAAFMLDGIGALIPSIYGGWADGPDEGMLEAMGIQADRPREALRDAYAAYRQAEKVVGKLDENLEARARQLADECGQKNDEANMREGVFAPDISPEEARERRERARASVAELEEMSRQAKTQCEAAFSAWRKAMVNQLLHSQAIKKQAELGMPTEQEIWEIAYNNANSVRWDALAMLDLIKQRDAILCMHGLNPDEHPEMKVGLRDKDVPRAIPRRVTAAPGAEDFFMTVMDALKTASSGNMKEATASDWVAWATKKGIQVHSRFRAIANWQDDIEHPIEQDDSPAQAEAAAPRLREQETTIISWLKKNGYDPKNLPVTPNGRKTAKTFAKAALDGKGVFTAPTAFGKAWGRLRNDKEIKEIGDG